MTCLGLADSSCGLIQVAFGPQGLPPLASSRAGAACVELSVFSWIEHGK